MFSDILILILAFLLSLSFHESAHAFAAHYLGDSTAKDAGRLTLNPIAHIDPFGALAILLVHFGWGKPVPVNPSNFSNPRRDNALVAFAGPASNFTLAFVSMGILLLLSRFSFGSLTSFFQILVELNLLLGLFNLIPLPPLDGGSVLLGILPKKIVPTVSNLLGNHGSILFFTLLAINLFFNIPIFTAPISFLAEHIRILFFFFWSGVL